MNSSNLVLAADGKKTMLCGAMWPKEEWNRLFYEPYCRQCKERRIEPTGKGFCLFLIQKGYDVRGWGARKIDTVVQLDAQGKVISSTFL